MRAKLLNEDGRTGWGRERERERNNEIIQLLPVHCLSDFITKAKLT